MMTQKASHVLNHNLALHSGDYVKRYNAKPLNRVQNLVKRMELTKTTRVADFACGNGMLLQAIGDHFGSYDGIDFSQDFIDAANEWAERTGRRNYRFHCRDIREYCIQNSQVFDVAATLDFSEHIDNTLAIEIYSSIRTSIRPGGKLYLHTPNLDFIVERAKQVGIIPQFPEHIAVRNGPQTAHLLEEAGFARDAIKVEVIPHYNFLKFLHPLSNLPVIGKYLGARLWIEAQA
ncbi:MAG: class I SAM-dependent methyltransferase [Novosphingobium sp.]|nr:class I SAM-dependent methyltransferase [Novosphingobium sp.]